MKLKHGHAAFPSSPFNSREYIYYIIKYRWNQSKYKIWEEMATQYKLSSSPFSIEHNQCFLNKPNIIEIGESDKNDHKMAT